MKITDGNGNYFCPECGGIMKYDSEGEKYRCPNCDAIYTFTIDLAKSCLKAQKWGSCDKPSNWEQMSEKERKFFLYRESWSQQMADNVNKIIREVRYE